MTSTKILRCRLPEHWGPRMRFVRNRSNRSGFFFRAEDAFGFTERIIREQQDLEDDEREMRDAVPGSGKDMAANVALKPMC